MNVTMQHIDSKIDKKLKKWYTNIRKEVKNELFNTTYSYRS